MKETKKTVCVQDGMAVESECRGTSNPQPTQKKAKVLPQQLMTREELVADISERSGISADKVERFTEVFLSMLTKRSTAYPVLSRVASFGCPSPYRPESVALFEDSLPLS